MSFAEFGPEGEYLKARSAVQLLKAERDTLSKDLRPRHPKILKLNDEIEKQEQLINLYRQDAVEKLDNRRKSIGTQMENLQSNIKEWEKKALVLSQQLAQFNRLKGKVDRQKQLYDRLTNSLKDVDMSQVSRSGRSGRYHGKCHHSRVGASRVSYESYWSGSVLVRLLVW